MGVGFDEGDASHSSNSDDSSSSSSRDTYLARLRTKFQESLGLVGALDTTDASDKVESMSVFIYESMSTSARDYHFVQHVFDVIDGNDCASGENTEPILDAVAVLAALFHDCVYANVDGCLSVSQRQKLQGAIVEETTDDGVVVASVAVVRTHPDSFLDPLLSMVLSIFGLEANRDLTPMTGLNEYLSAVIAVRELEGLLSFKLLVQVAVCTEATIPFRPVNDRGETALDRLYSRLLRTVETFSVDLTEQECVQAVQRAALLANEDVGNFGTDDPGWFLDNTWSLLPETNKALRQDNRSAQQLQCAFFKMHGFLSFLKPDLVFQQFRGVPTAVAIEHLTLGAARNLKVGSTYVAARLVAVSCLASFAELTGGDTSVSSVMGDLPSLKISLSKLQMEGPLLSADQTDRCPDVYRLLAHGRHKDTSFDVRQSPVAAYFYACLGDEGLKRVVSTITCPITPESARALLNAMPKEVLAHALEKVTLVSRRDQIMDVLHSLPGNEKDHGNEKAASK